MSPDQTRVLNSAGKPRLFDRVAAADCTRNYLRGNLMTLDEQKALMTIALLAAFADGGKDDTERDAVKRVAESLPDGEVNTAALLQDVLFKRVNVQQAATALVSPETKQLAFELAVGVCDADRLRNDAETRFLSELGAALGLSSPQMSEPAATADALATAPLAVPDAAAAAATAATVAAAAVPTTTSVPPVPSAPTVSGPVVAATPREPEAEIDKSILNTSILNGALELLPQSLASLAIIALQMKLVVRVGEAYGYELDRGHVKDLLATLGIGMTGQYIEQFGRKLVGGLFGKAAGKLIGGLAGGASGMAMSFATTYAIGHVAKRYYAGGRTMSTQVLKDTYTQLLGNARGLQAQYAGQIQQQAKTIDVRQLTQLVTGSR
jgi:uncharacterized protein (DUF697 family)/tellurite resistance protein